MPDACPGCGSPVEVVGIERTYGGPLIRCEKCMAPLPLEVGVTYRAIGPDPENGGKWEAPVVTIVGTTEKGYVTEGDRQPSKLILYGCERFWEVV